MVAVKAPFGFKPSRSLNGNFNPATRRYPIQANGTYARHALYVGSPVCLVTSAVGHVQLAAVASAAEPAPIGVVAGLLDTNQRPLTFSLPTRGPVALPSAAGFADVYVDQGNIYWVSTDTTAAGANVGACVGVSAYGSAHANVATGRSPIGIVLGTDTSATRARPWRIVGPSPTQRDFNENADWTDGVEVVLAFGGYLTPSL